MKLDNHDLVLRGLLNVLPLHLEPYLRNMLGDRCTPEILHALLAGSGPVPELPDLADLSTQIRILTARGADGRYLLHLPPGAGSKLHEVRRFRNEAVHGARFDADKTLAALVAVSELLRLIGAEPGRAQVRELIGAINEGRGVHHGPLDALEIQVETVPVIGYAHAVAGLKPEVSVRLALPGSAAEPRIRSAASYPGRPLPGPADAVPPRALESIDVTLRIIEDDGGRELVEPWHFTWDARRHPDARNSRRLVLLRRSLAQIDNSGAAHARIELRTGTGETAIRRVGGLAALAPRHWRLTGGNGWAGPALATFVQPGQPVVQALAAEAGARVTTAHTGPDQDDAVAAACAVLRARRLGLSTGAAWQEEPQAILTAAELLDARTGSALDVAVLLAGVLERLAVNPILLFTPASVLVGYSRNIGGGKTASPEALAALVRSGDIGLVDPSIAVHSPAAVLHELTGRARQIALEALADLRLVLPLDAARSDGAAPQPLLERDEDDVVVEVEPPTALTPEDAASPDADSPALEEPAAATPTPERSVPAADAPAPPQVEVWKRGLLDLSLRNPLIDRAPRNAIEIKTTSAQIGELENIVNKRELITLRPTAGGRARGSGSGGPTAAGPEQLLADHTVEVAAGRKEYDRRLPSLAAAARTTLEETGANNLYLTIGTLVWHVDGRRVRSPLILVPVKLERAGDTFGIILDEAGASTPNYSLLARFQADTGMELTTLREPVHDEHGVNVPATLDNLRRQLRAARRRARVELTVHLGLFDFSTYRMWRDLAEDWPTITANPLVARLLGAEDEATGAGTAVQSSDAPDVQGPENLDAVAESLPLVADSDQARVIADAVAGRSLVVEGPPGTGKSQTVANLIFRALAAGRTVMFVAEKLSALNVVARRLHEETGIGDLLLNLHDNGMRPALVREALRRALELSAPEHDAAAAADGVREQLTAARSELEDYRDRLHAPRQGGASYYRVRQELVGARDEGGAKALRAQDAFDTCAARTGLDDFDASEHTELLTRYRRLQEQLRQMLTPELLAAVLGRRERVLRGAGARAEELRRELERRKGTMNVRDLIDSYWDLITAITPCILVSPDSVARFFPAHRRYVDVIVFDEASQITVANAVGAMGRGTTVVVVGDPKQMPPSPSPGTAATAGRGTPGDGGAESILERCLSEGVLTRRLTWHYRSRVESLIAFSNRQYYDGRLLSFPSPLAITSAQDDGPHGYGISLRRVAGTYYRAGAAKHPGIRPNTNPVEARQIVEEVKRRFEASPQITPSLGVITFSARQCELIEAELRGTGSERIVAALEARDGLFVRNLENVQGEERDTILISVTFSANERGDLPLNFGSLGHAGGQRRLNVAITRARRQIIVFSSFDPEDLHAERSTHQGLKDLRDYLVRARSGAAPRALPASRSAVDFHRNEIAERLREAGLEATVGVGHSTFEIDLVLTGARGPRVAVLLDGPGWDRRVSVADRDLLPVDVLRSMGWERVERVWMPDWVAHEQQVVARLVDAVGAGKDLASKAPAPGGAVLEAQVPDAPEPDEPTLAGPAPEASAAVTGVSEYRPWQPVGVQPTAVLNRAQDRNSPERVQVVETARAICDVESPLTRHRLIVKICRAYGLTRVAGSCEQRVDELLGDAFAYTDAEGFVWRNQDAARLTVPYRRNALDHVDSIEEIHPRELVSLMREVRADTPAWASPEELCTRALRRLSAKKRRLSARGVKDALMAALRQVEREEIMR